MNLPCPECRQPEHCLGRWPDDDPHRPGEVRGCFAAKTRTVAVRSTGTAIALAADRRLSRDLDAYRRLRRDGLQPPRIDGSAERELLDVKHRIEETPPPQVLERLESS